MRVEYSALAKGLSIFFARLGAALRGVERSANAVERQNAGDPKGDEVRLASTPCYRQRPVFDRRRAE